MNNKIKDVDVQVLNDCVLVNKNTLVIGDLHLGYEDQFAGRAVFPNLQLKEIIDKLNENLEEIKEQNISLKKIILLGDVKHDFGNISDQEWAETLQLLDFLKKHTEQVIVIKGNHDTKLKPILDKRNISLSRYYKDGGICYVHGDRDPDFCENADTIITSHMHPAITLSDDYKKEKYKCILKGKHKGKTIYVLPSFSNVSMGFDLLDLRGEDEYFFVSFRKLKEFEVIIYNPKENKALNFGKLRNL